MNTASLLCILAMIAYSTEISIADQKLSNVSPKVLTVFYSSAVLIIAAFFVLGQTSALDYRTFGQWFALSGLVICWILMLGLSKQDQTAGLRWPEGNEWWWVAAMGIASFIGGWSHFAALNQHAGALKLSMFYMLLPVCTAIPTILLKGEWPTWKTLLAWVLAGIAIWLVTDQEK